MPMNYEPIPETYEQALSQIVDGLTEEEREWMRSNHQIHLFLIPGQTMPPETFNISGMAIRNAWNLWGAIDSLPTTLRDDFKTRFRLGHADDMTGMLQDEAWAIVRGQPFDREAEIARYHRHWAEYGVDPVTQEKLPKRRWW